MPENRLQKASFSSSTVLAAVYAVSGAEGEALGAVLDNHSTDDARHLPTEYRVHARIQKASTLLPELPVLGFSLFINYFFTSSAEWL